MTAREQRLRALLVAVPDFPSAGIVFQDVTPLLADPRGLAEAVEALAEPWAGAGVTHVAGVEARGFVLGAPVALALGAGFVPLRKPGKLPRETHAASYDLEYGTDALHVHAGALPAGARVLVLDDVLATGGTAAAAAALVTRDGAEVLGLQVLLEIAALGGRSRLAGLRVEAVLPV